MKLRRKEGVVLALLALYSLVFAWIFIGMGPYLSIADINDTAEINTTVNITNSAPEVREVFLPTTISLEAYGNRTVQCNVTVYDYDNNVDRVNATLYYYLNNSNDQDDNNVHYSNASCVNVTGDGVARNFTCTFSVAFYANNGTWYCNATAADDYDATGDNRSNAAIVNSLVAIYVPGIIDFGEMTKGDITITPVEANLTNAGNRRINISVEGWGESKADGLAMNCTYGNIARQYEKYNITSEPYTSMYELQTSPTMIPDFYILKRTSASSDSTNKTYWRLEIPSGAGGICTGKVLFTASDYSG